MSDETTTPEDDALIPTRRPMGYLLQPDGATYVPSWNPFTLEAQLMNQDLRQVGDTTVDDPHWGTIRVSTVFLAVDHGFNYDRRPDYRPVLWETMVFGGPDTLDKTQWRYTSRSDAEAGHAAAVVAVQQALRADAEARQPPPTPEQLSDIIDLEGE